MTALLIVLSVMLFIIAYNLQSEGHYLDAGVMFLSTVFGIIAYFFLDSLYMATVAFVISYLVLLICVR